MLALDHIVFAGSDVHDLSADYGHVALKSIKGGEHDDWGTHNFLAYFSNNCYIEWLAVNDATVARSSDNPLIQHLVHVLDNQKQGPFQIALRTTKLDTFVKHFEDNNIPFIGPVHGKRMKPDGTLLQGRMLFPTYNYDEETLPFLIEWGESEAERFDISLVNSQAITEIQLGSLSKERFQQIYQIRSRVKSRPVRLKNTTVTFTRDGKISMNVV